MNSLFNIDTKALDDTLYNQVGATTFEIAVINGMFYLNDNYNAFIYKYDYPNKSIQTLLIGTDEIWYYNFIFESTAINKTILMLNDHIYIMINYSTVKAFSLLTN